MVYSDAYHHSCGYRNDGCCSGCWSSPCCCRRKPVTDCCPWPNDCYMNCWTPSTAECLTITNNSNVPIQVKVYFNPACERTRTSSTILPSATLKVGPISSGSPPTNNKVYYLSITSKCSTSILYGGTVPSTFGTAVTVTVASNLAVTFGAAASPC